MNGKLNRNNMKNNKGWDWDWDWDCDWEPPTRTPVLLKDTQWTELDAPIEFMAYLISNN